MIERVLHSKTHGDFVLILNDEDADLLDCTWGVVKDRRNFYAQRGALVDTPRGLRPLRIHRAVFARMLGRELTPKDIVDHINGNGLDNRRSNLRATTHRANALNRIEHRAGRLQGATPGRNGRWRAFLGIKGKVRALGTFDTEQEAHTAYIAAREHYGIR